MKFQSGRWLNGYSLCEKKRRRLAARSASVWIPCSGSFMESRSVNKQCWHYTTGQCAAMIIESKVLRPADCDISPREKPIVWFSANQFWELTANKGIIDGGIRRTATMEETAHHGGGLFRFGVSEERLIRWPRIGELANIEPNMRRRLDEGRSRSRCESSRMVWN